MSRKSFSGGDKLKAVLDELAKKTSGSNLLSVGFPEGSTEEDGTPTPLVAFLNEYGHVVRGGSYSQLPRPFFRPMIQEGEKHWGEDLGKILKHNDYDAAVSLKQLGLSMEGELVDSIKSVTSPPLAPSTVAAKGFDKPLIDTGAMWQNVTSFVESK